MSKNITNGRDEPQTAAALEARRVTAQAAHQRVHHVLARMRKEKAPITVAAVARRALLTELCLEFQQFSG